jgi:acyl-CoA dehydrogenase
MILVPMDAEGITVERALTVYGYDDAPHGHMEIALVNVRVPAANLLLGEGRGFEIAQGRLGPGRIHHCMRVIGAAEEALGLMCERLQSRIAFGKRVSDHSIWEQRVAEARIEIEATRLLCLKAADMMDRAGNKAARAEIAMIKVKAPQMALKVIDDAVQAFGGAGVSQDTPLAMAWAHIRTLRLADGPDEVHNRSIAKLEFEKHRRRDINFWVCPTTIWQWSPGRRRASAAPRPNYFAAKARLSLPAIGQPGRGSLRSTPGPKPKSRL